MRHFEFQLRLPDGRVVDAEAIAEPWRWTDAFTEACAKVEARHGLGPYAGIVCVGYRKT